MASPLNASSVVQAQEFIINDAVSCAAAHLGARRLALVLGFPGTASEEIVLVVSELASNLVKHAGSGILTLRPLLEGARRGLEVDASDHGPGISNIEMSFADGYSTCGSLGYGLGTVNRLMDEVDIHSIPSSGTQMTCRRWLRNDFPPGRASLWDVGVFTRSRRQALQNGDAFIIKQANGEILTGVIDGLGHGDLAQKAAAAAQQYVQSHHTQPLDKIFQGVGRACKATRGVVMALARLNKPLARLQFASLGNIEVRAWCGAERISFTLKRGFLAVQESNVRVQEFSWKPEWLLVLHSDGLRTHWQWSDFPGIEREPADVAAARLMRALATDNDDATVLTVRERTA